MTIYRLGLSHQVYRSIGSQVSVRAFKYNCLKPLTASVNASLWQSESEQKHFATTASLTQYSKIRKQIKNKNLKKDPNFKPWEMGRIGSHTKKYVNKHLKKTRDIELWKGITLQQLSEQLELDVDDVLDVILSLKGVNTDYIQSEHSEIRDTKIWSVLANKLQFKFRVTENPSNKHEKVHVDKDVYRDAPAREDEMTGRPPVITIMGHIDHGKTSLLDHLRQSRIVAGEAGGITQHIGAFSVTLESGSSITFIDTPGHAAFTAMRTRGASSTDIVILIVDACEGVLDQTVESLRIIRQARVPFIVAINKIDKSGADIENTKKQLLAEGVRLEETGGDVQCIPISAVKGTNIRQLTEAILTQAEMMELKCDLKGRAEAVIIESQVELGLGKTASLLLQRGCLAPGDLLVAGSTWCKIRLMMDDRGERLKRLRPSEAAKIVGWRGEAVPSAGTEVLSVESEARAREVVSYREAAEARREAESQVEVIADQRRLEREQYQDERKLKLDKGFLKRNKSVRFQRSKESAEDSDTPSVSVIVKGDVDGSIDAILSVLDSYQEEEVKLDIVNFGVGQVSENDVNMAESFDAIIYAFNTSIPHNVQKQADSSKVPVRCFDVIYHLIGDLKMEITSKMPQLVIEDILGRANVLQEFQIKDKKNLLSVAGSRVVSGKITRSSVVKVIRGQDCVYQGGLASLKHMKDEVSEIIQNQECGLRVPDEELRFQPGDVILSVETRTENDKCKWDPGF